MQDIIEATKGLFGAGSAMFLFEVDRPGMPPLALVEATTSHAIMLLASVAAAIPAGPRVLSVLATAHRAGLPVLLEGATGIGKSELIEQAASSLGIECRVLDLTDLESPATLPHEGRGFLVLDDLSRADRHRMRDALQILMAGRLHDHWLPPGWLSAGRRVARPPGWPSSFRSEAGASASRRTRNSILD
jgi:hypothetical protein